ncbi:hypothetical protein GCM10009665_24720 [Kitasatospora nipponensis]|uniref:WD40 repeat protein n=2 Tax=Kitasatospora nipponensis TaxID=258049 RepID=A0ABN1W5H4_9ACTN
MNGTAGSRLTISNGTRYVLMNGTSVDFGTAVRDLTWSPDGRKAVFVDGDGDLVTADPGGGGRVVVARHAAGQSWSHPAWESVPSSYGHTLPQQILFVADAGGVTTLETVPADAVNGTPTALPLQLGEGRPEVPQTANTWPNTGGGSSDVYANTQTGDIYIRDGYARMDSSDSVFTPGTEPTLSTDGEEVVFVRSVGGHDHIFEQQVDRQGSAKDLTPNATVDYSEPAVSPDRTTIAVRTPDGIATLPADGSAAPRLVSTDHGLPAYR